ncbi:MAG: DUF4982 domain-containing protein [Bacteroidales bacterium]|nr:DUF4982 domain-containing protein [Bacteroidales bacterium]
MKIIRANLLLLVLFCFLMIPLHAQKNNKQLFDYNWKFVLGDPKDAQQPDFSDANWRVLDLPHDWSIEGKVDENAPTGGSGGFLPTGTGWYRKHFKIPVSARGKIISIEFDGVYMNSDVWINGQHLGKRPYGYISFYYDLTPYLKEEDNVIAVRVDNSNQPNTRWYSGSGIYRHVWLRIKDPLHIKPWGIYATTPNISAESAEIVVKTRIENFHSKTQNGTLVTYLKDSEGKEISKTETIFELNSGKETQIEQTLLVSNPKLWSIETPDLYKLHSAIINGNKTLDNEITVIGIREIVYDATDGFLLNGQRFKMNGVNLHHDGGCVGAAVPEGIWERRLLKLKEMGCNAIRTAHNPPAPEFLDLCDRLGFLVMDEAFDEWRFGKREFAYHIYFEKWWKQDLLSMIRRDRNHPSIVLWSVGNEIPDQKSDDGHIILKELMDAVYSADSTRPVTAGLDNIAADGGATTLEFMEGLDIVGYNYADRWHERRELMYSIDKINHPDWKMIGTESVSLRSIRGDYSLGENPVTVMPDYNANMIRVEQLWKFVATRSYVAGDFMWTGIDYLGESWWPHKNSSSGVIDLCGFPKDGFYFYQSQWTKKPIIHLFPHWNWEGREGQIIPVLAYTNCDAVELFLNGKSYGEKRLEFPRQGTSGGWNTYDQPQIFPTTADLHLSWDVPYEPGIIKVVGKKNGEIVATEILTTTGPPQSIKLSADKTRLEADKRDIAHIKVEITDAEGNVVPTANNHIYFTVEGEGKLLGVDNGNPADHAIYSENHRQTFNGLALVIIQSTHKPGVIRLKAQSENLTEARIEIKTDNPEHPVAVFEWVNK